MDTRKNLVGIVERISAKLASTNKQIAELLAEDAATLATLTAVGFVEGERLVLSLRESGLATRRDVLEAALIKLSASLAVLTPAMTPDQAKDKIQELIATCSKFDQLCVTIPEEVVETLIGSSAQLDICTGQEYGFKFSKMLTFSLSDIAREIKAVRASYSPEHVTAIKQRVAKEKAEAQAKRDKELRPVPTVAEYEAMLAERKEKRGDVPLTPEQQAKYDAALRERQEQAARQHPREGRVDDGMRPMQEGGVLSGVEWELRES